MPVLLFVAGIIQRGEHASQDVASARQLGGAEASGSRHRVEQTGRLASVSGADVCEVIVPDREVKVIRFERHRPSASGHPEMKRWVSGDGD